MVARRPVIVMGVFRASTRNRIPYTNFVTKKIRNAFAKVLWEPYLSRMNLAPGR